jgi:hypothetical protein
MKRRNAKGHTVLESLQNSTAWYRPDAETLCLLLDHRLMKLA